MDRRAFFRLLGGTAAAILVPKLWLPKKTYFLPLGQCWGISEETYFLWKTNCGEPRVLTFEMLQEAIRRAVQEGGPDAL